MALIGAATARQVLGGQGQGARERWQRQRVNRQRNSARGRDFGGVAG
jgi:hypothetical protein